MRHLLLAAAFALIAVAAQAQVDPRYAKELAANAPGSGDQLLPRYAGSFILAQTKKDFDEIVLPLGKTIGAGYASEPDKKLRFEKVTTVEGRLTRTLYVIPEGRSVLEVVRNYTNELEGKGATTLFQCSKVECGEEFYKLQAFARALKPEGAAYTRERRALAANALPPRAVRDAAASCGIGLEFMSTPEAARLYNVLTSEGRRLACGLVAV